MKPPTCNRDVSRAGLFVTDCVCRHDCYIALQFFRTGVLPPWYKDLMDRPEHILIVDDDAEIRGLLRDYLERHGLRAQAVPDGRGMHAALANGRFDLVILDLMLPGEDGLTLCRDLRAHSNLPVIMLTARGEETDRIVGLEMGADDYVPKPFNPRELLARIKAVLRRSQTLPPLAAAEASGLRFAGWTLDLTHRQLTSSDGVVVALSGGEYRLLTVFLEHPNRVLTRDQLLDLTRGRESTPFDRSIDVQVGRLRRRLGDTGPEPMLIKTVRGEGYVLAATVETQK
jgi:two-component system OmpR family response regulator